MTNTDLAETIRFNAGCAIDTEGRARKALADVVSTGGYIDAHTLKPVMTAQAEALPWRQVLNRLEKAGALEALDSVREECTELLLERSESQSTCAITNDLERMRRDAARNFLRNTRRLRRQAA